MKTKKIKSIIKKSANQNVLSLLLITVGLALIAVAAYLANTASSAIPTNLVKAPNSKQLTASSIKPSTKAVSSYSVAPTLPKYINIPSIGVNARVLRLGLLKNGQIATPDNIFDTGWYDGSAKPGQKGAMFIYGHVSSWTADGVFYSLKKLKPGDRIIITRGDNKIFTYIVIKSNVYPYNAVDMNTVLSPISPNTPGLNLMTCTGQVIKGTSEFNERLVVFSELS